MVCPTTVLHQWAAEVRAKVSPASGVTVHVYHGKGGWVRAWSAGTWPSGRLAGRLRRTRAGKCALLDVCPCVTRSTDS